MIRKTFGLSWIALAIVGMTCEAIGGANTHGHSDRHRELRLLLRRQPGLQQTRRDRAGGATGIDADFLQLHRTGGHRQSERHTRQRDLVDSGDHHKLYSHPAARTGYRGHHPQLLRGLGMGDPAGGRNARRHDHGYRNGVRSSSTRFARGAVSDRCQHHGDNRRNRSVPGNARAGRLLTDHRYRTRRLGSRRSFHAKSSGRWNAQLPAHLDPPHAAGDPEQRRLVHWCCIPATSRR